MISRFPAPQGTQLICFQFYVLFERRKFDDNIYARLCGYIDIMANHQIVRHKDAGTQSPAAPLRQLSS